MFVKWERVPCILFICPARSVLGQPSGIYTEHWKVCAYVCTDNRAYRECKKFCGGNIWWFTETLQCLRNSLAHNTMSTM